MDNNQALAMKRANRHIFFLTFDSDLKEIYFYLAEMFLLYDFTLVPVSLEGLKELANSERQFVISLSQTIKERRILKKFQKQYLDYALLNKVFYFYDLSSFMPLFHKRLQVRRLNYMYLALPVKLSMVAEVISIHVESNLELGKSWPGGRRPLLPKLIQTS